MPKCTFSHDAVGNIIQDILSGGYNDQRDHTTNHRNRLTTVTVGGRLKASYIYNGL